MEIYLNERELIIKDEDNSRRNLWIERRKIKDINYKKKKELEEEKIKEQKKLVDENVKFIQNFVFKLITQRPGFDKFRKIFEQCFDDFGQSSDKCPYAVLGLSKNTSLEKCRSEFKKQALLLHPDRNFGATTEQKKKNLEMFKLKSAAMDMIENIHF